MFAHARTVGPSAPETVTVGSVVATVSGTGSVVPGGQLNLDFRTAGKIPRSTSASATR